MTKRNARQIKKAELGTGNHKKKRRQVTKRISSHHPKTPADVISLLRSFNDCVEVLEDGRVKYYSLRHNGVKYTYQVYVDGDFSLFIVDGIASAAALHVRGTTIYGSYEFPSRLDFIGMDKCNTPERFFQHSLIEDTFDYEFEDIQAIMAELTEIRGKMNAGEPILQ